MFSHAAAGFAGLASARCSLANARPPSRRPTGANGHALPAEGQGGDSAFSARRPEPHGLARSQAGAERPQRAADARVVHRSGQAHGPRQPAGHAVQVPAVGQCGVEYSELLPHTAKCADDIAVIRSMYTEHNNHEQALWQMHTGRIVPGRPTLGSWVNYALGSENQNLPAYVVLRNDSSLPIDGTRNWSSGLLPPRYQGVHFRHTGTPVLYLQPTTAVSQQTQERRRDLLRELERRASGRAPHVRARPRGPHRQLRNGRPDAAFGRAGARPGRGRRPRRWPCTASASRRPTATAAAA